MTRTYAAVRLLALGPLTMAEFHAITGWKRNRCNNVLRRLRAQRKVERANVGGRSLYRLTTGEA